MIIPCDQQWRQLQTCLAEGRLTGPAGAAFEAEPSLAPYQPLIAAHRRQQPLVIGQLGQSLDGRIATATGHSHYINGPAALDHLHRLRALVDAVVVGAGTVMADRPRLTVRRVEGNSPVRVVIDPNGRTLGIDSWRPETPARQILVHCDDLQPDGATTACQHIGLPAGPDGRLSVPAIQEALAARGLHRLLIEGGADTVSAWLAAGALDRLHLLIGPVIIGAGQTGLNLLPAIDKLDHALRPELRHYPLPGGDLLIDCALT